MEVVIKMVAKMAGMKEGSRQGRVWYDGCKFDNF